MAASHVELTGKPAATCRNLTRAFTLGISEALLAARVGGGGAGAGDELSGDWWYLPDRREKRHRQAPVVSRHPLRRTLDVSSRTCTACLP